MTAVVGDKLSHGGKIISGSEVSNSFGLPVARVGDKALCDSHGEVTIIKGSKTRNCGGKPVATAGDKCSCGAVILPNKYAGK